MPLELMEPDTSGNKPAFPGARGFLVLAKLRGMRNVTRESFKRLRAFTTEYSKDRFPNSMEEDSNGQEVVVEKKEEEEKVEGSESDTSPESDIKFGPHEIMYENCCFILCNLVDPSDYAHYAFSKMADDPKWPQPRFPLRIMPVQEICCLTPKAVEAAVKPLLEKVFGGEDAVRFSIIFHGKAHQDSKDMTRNQIESVIRNIIWAINPNCVQCIKYQDYAVLLEVVDPLLFVGIAKDFNQLGRYNTATIHTGRDLKETMDDSEDDISDDPELSEADNIKRKLRIKKKRRAEKAGEEEKNKQGKFEGGEENAEDDDAAKDDEELARDENNDNGDEDINGN